MVNFKKLSSSQATFQTIAPKEIFDRLRKPANFDDLHHSQAEALDLWFGKRDSADTIVKLNTGGGKTLVGLLIAVSSARELGKGALYLVDSKQLVTQVCNEANSLGIPAIEYNGRDSICSDFRSGKAVMVAHYQALFNGQSSFGLNYSREPEDVSAIIIDDAHSSFDAVRDTFTVTISAEDDPMLFRRATAIFRPSFCEIDRETTFDDLVEGKSGLGADILEVPFWAWLENYTTISRLISEKAPVRDATNRTLSSIIFNWPLIKDNLKYCQAIISRNTLSISPILPMVDQFPTFSNAPRRVYMSATFADEGAIIRTFGCKAKNLSVISPQTLAGIGRRMILQLDEMTEQDTKLISVMSSVAKSKVGVVVLEPTFASANRWEIHGFNVIKGSNVEKAVTDLRSRSLETPVVFTNRYNGLDLPGDACRLLVVSCIPSSMSAFQRYFSYVLSQSKLYARSIAQKIEQAIGRGTRGSGDYCVVILLGHDLCEWVKDPRHFPFFTSSTRAQIQCGEAIMSCVESEDDFFETVNQGINNDSEFADYLTNYVVDYISSATNRPDDELESFSSVERDAFFAWRNGHDGKATNALRCYASSDNCEDDAIRGYALQIAAQIEYANGNIEEARQLQERAHGSNPMLVKASMPLPTSSATRQAQNIVELIERIENLGEDVLSHFNTDVMLDFASGDAKSFEISLEKLGLYLGADSQRFDKNGDGPDVLWYFPEAKLGFVLEAKSEKEQDTPFSKREHGQLLVATKWFSKNYPEAECVPVSVHPNDTACGNASAESTRVFIPDNLSKLRSDVCSLITTLSSQLTSKQYRLTRCDTMLNELGLFPYIIKDELLSFYRSLE